MLFSNSITIFSSHWLYIFFFFLPCYIIFIFISYFFYFFTKTSSLSTFNRLLINNKYILYFFILWLGLIIFTSWTYTLHTSAFWYSHFFLSGFALNILNLFFLIFLIFLIFLALSFNFSTQLFVDFLFLFLFLIIWFFYMYMSTNLFSVIFSIEILTLSIFTLGVNLFISNIIKKNLISAQSNFNMSYSFNSFYFLLIFFWVSAITSIFLFIFLIFFNYTLLNTDWFLLDIVALTCTDFGSLGTFIPYSFVFILFFLLIFFKFGLPPFFFWKIVFFFNVSYTFLSFYICYFYLFLFIYFVYLLFYIMNYFLFYFNFIFMLFLLSISFFIFIVALYSTSIKNFLVFSSSINSLLILFVYSVACFDLFITQSLKVCFLYFILYNLSLLLFFFYIITFNATSVSFFSLFKYINNVKQNLFFFLFLSFAGLPPMFSFFLKFSIVSFIFSSSLYLLFLFIIFFLFFIIYFYFSLTKNLLYLYDNKVYTKLMSSNTGISHVQLLLELTLIILLSLGFLLFSDIAIFINFLFLL